MDEDPKFWLIADSTAEEVGALTGLWCRDTPLGVLVQRPPEVNIAAMMEPINRALNRSRCTCGPFAIIHRSDCPAGCWT